MFGVTGHMRRPGASGRVGGLSSSAPHPAPPLSGGIRHDTKARPSRPPRRHGSDRRGRRPRPRPGRRPVLRHHVGLPRRRRDARPGDAEMVNDVRAGRHACFDRLVVDLGGQDTTFGSYDVRYVPAGPRGRPRATPFPSGAPPTCRSWCAPRPTTTGGTPPSTRANDREVVDVHRLLDVPAGRLGRLVRGLHDDGPRRPRPAAVPRLHPRRDAAVGRRPATGDRRRARLVAGTAGTPSPPRRGRRPVRSAGGRDLRAGRRRRGGAPRWPAAGCAACPATGRPSAARTAPPGCRGPPAPGRRGRSSAGSA